MTTPDDTPPPSNRSDRELLAYASSGAIGFTKSALQGTEADYLRGLATFLTETDEFIFTRNPLQAPVVITPDPDPTQPTGPSDGDG